MTFILIIYGIKFIAKVKLKTGFDAQKLKTDILRFLFVVYVAVVDFFNTIRLPRAAWQPSQWRMSGMNGRNFTDNRFTLIWSII